MNVHILNSNAKSKIDLKRIYVSMQVEEFAIMLCTINYHALKKKKTQQKN